MIIKVLPPAALLAFFCLSSIEAQAQTTIEVTTLVDEDDGSSALLNLNDISLREAINHSPAGAEITFRRANSTIELTQGPLLIDKDLSIEGLVFGTFRTTIQGNGQYRLLEINSQAIVTISNLILTGGDATASTSNDQGGAIFLNEANLTLEQCDLIGNAAGFGGAIYSLSDSDSSILTINQSTIADNTAFRGGGIAGFGDSRDSNLTITNSTLSGNSASVGGAIDYFTDRRDTVIELTNCTLTQNSADEGGAIYSDATDRADVFLNLTHTTITGNTAQGTGGGISNNAEDDADITVTIEDSIIALNEANSSNDYLEQGDGTTTHVLDTNGTNLISDFSGSPLSSSATLIQVSGDANSANPLALSPLGNYGGPTQTMHPLADSLAILSSNDTRADQRGFTFTGPETIGSVKLGPTTIVNNIGDNATTITTLRKAITDTANIQGAVIQFDSGLTGQTITLTEGELLINAANDLFVDAANRNLTIDANGQTTNHRVMTIDSGGASHATLQGLTLQGGNAVSGSLSNQAGGGLSVAAFVTLNSCTIRDNNAEWSGGGIYSRGSDESTSTSVTLNDCLLTNNEAGIFGGAIRSTAGRATASLTFTGTTFSNNSSGRFGGAISTEGGEVDLEVDGRNSIFSNNSSDLGGALYTEYSSADVTIDLKSCSFTGNTALTHGGSIYNAASDAGGSFHIIASTFANNSAADNGGAICSIVEVADVTFDLLNCTFAANSADSGGAIFANDAFSSDNTSTTFLLDHCTLTQNTADTAGGGVHLQGLEDANLLFQIENSILADNSAPLGPDLREDPDPTATLVVDLEDNNLFSSVAGSSLSTSAPGLVIASDPLLTALGQFGGPTPTMLPLPNSPALDAATPASVGAIDQRGFTRPLDGDNDGNALPDLGAAESPNWTNPGPADYLSIWLTDQDQDGSPWGLEQAIGTNPAIADPSNILNLCPPLIQPTGAISLTFGLDPDAVEGTSLSLTRSLTLQATDFALLFKSTDDLFIIPDFTDQVSNPSDTIEFLDTNPPSPKAFYRLEADYNP